MREDTRRKFEQAIWRDRMRKIGIAAAIAVLIAGFTVLWSLDASTVNTRIPGEITHVGPLVGTSTQAAQEGLSVDVKLDAGGNVRDGTHNLHLEVRHGGVRHRLHSHP